MGMDQDIAEVLYSEKQLQRRVAELGAQISKDYENKEDVVLVGILRGCYVFMADLSRYITIPCRMDFMSVSSYGKGTSSSGQIEIKKDLSDTINGAHVILVEDILDSGNTMDYLKKVLSVRNAASIRICTLLDKPERRTKPVTADYYGFLVPDAFVVGYGLDYAEKYRNLPYIGILKPEIYE
ncbi:MAG: hypoxanthine phosphoribosyltransferase [Clostridiales bacterium]|nr:hypoxanthine phosphoribosyltransferase [Clostridiales bacterium]MCD7753630.1 hypoxanthine phosphoribosyltransferase [Clostridiales bacterium]MCD7803461.1 hypoxanthine phosphoribosyltransferase [Clostridiales bacterium]